MRHRQLLPPPRRPLGYGISSPGTIPERSRDGGWVWVESWGAARRGGPDSGSIGRKGINDRPMVSIDSTRTSAWTPSDDHRLSGHRDQLGPADHGHRDPSYWDVGESASPRLLIITDAIPRFPDSYASSMSVSRQAHNSNAGSYPPFPDYSSSVEVVDLKSHPFPQPIRETRDPPPTHSLLSFRKHPMQSKHRTGPSGTGWGRSPQLTGHCSILGEGSFRRTPLRCCLYCVFA